MTNNIKVLFFATFRDRTGVRETCLEIQDDSNVSQIKQLLIDRFPMLHEILPGALVAINKEFAFDEDKVPANSEVAIFPPVSGGNY